MTADPLVLMPEVDHATRRLLDTVAGLDDAAISRDSRLPGWSIGHVLAHVARNADSLVNLLTWARTGVVTPQYGSAGEREAGIAADADRPAAEHARDLADSAARFADAVARMPAGAWAARVGTPTPGPATAIVWRRLREVEVHHVDLGLAYQPADWPEAFRHRLLHEVVAGLGTRGSAAPGCTIHAEDLGHDLPIGEGGPRISGPSYALAAWLSGRGDGGGLAVDPPGPLPVLPAWI